MVICSTTPSVLYDELNVNKTTFVLRFDFLKIHIRAFVMAEDLACTART